MLALHPKYLKDSEGNDLVVLPLSEFKAIMEEFDDIEDVRLYDEAKREDDGIGLSFSEYLKNRESQNG